VIAKRLALDIAREDDRVQPQEIDDRPDDRRSPEDAAILREYAEQLETFLSELKPEWSKAFILHALENMTEVEIAKVLGVSRRQAQRYLDKVSARLKKTFGRKLP
jgi:RNA polymerase sigma factor (sigma-70 family)